MIEPDSLSSQTQLDSEKNLSQEARSTNTLVIDVERTAEFYKSKDGDEKGSNELRIAVDPTTGETKLLKFSGYLFGKDRDHTSLLTEEEYIDTHDEYEVSLLEDHSERLGLSEAAYLLAKRLGVSMAETRKVEVDGTPGISYTYLPGATDRGFGGGTIEYSADQNEMKNQEAQLAAGAFFKVITGNINDGGQYLQTPDGNIYLSDIEVSKYVLEASEPKKILFEIFEQGISPGKAYLATKAENLQHQLSGINSEAFLALAENVLTLSEQELSSILMAGQKAEFKETADRLAKVILDRAKATLPVFTVFARYPKETQTTVITTNPMTREQLHSNDEIGAARVVLMRALKEATPA